MRHIALIREFSKQTEGEVNIFGKIHTSGDGAFCKFCFLVCLIVAQDPNKKLVMSGWLPTIFFVESTLK